MSNHTKMWVVVLPSALMALALLGVATAGPANTPNTFVPNTPALASEVNQNFAAHEFAIDDNDSRITDLENGAVDGVVKAAASIDADGTVDRFFNLVGAAVTVDKNQPGIYRVTFGGFTDLDDRFYTVSIGGPAEGDDSGFSGVTTFTLSPQDTLFITTFDETGAQVDRPFYVVVY